MKRLISTAFVLGFVVFVVRVVGAQGGQGPAGGLHRVAHGSSMVGSGTTASQLDVLAGSGLFIDASGLEIGCGSGVSCAADSIYVDTSYAQKRVTGSCSAGNYVRVINSDGSVTCGADSGGVGTITGVTAGTNITGGGTSGTVTVSVTDQVSLAGVAGSSYTFIANGNSSNAVSYSDIQGLAQGVADCSSADCENNAVYGNAGASKSGPHNLTQRGLYGRSDNANVGGTNVGVDGYAMNAGSGTASIGVRGSVTPGGGLYGVESVGPMYGTSTLQIDGDSTLGSGGGNTATVNGHLSASSYVEGLFGLRSSGDAIRIGSTPSASVSASGAGALIYNNSTHTMQASTNGGAYVDLGAVQLGAANTFTASQNVASVALTDGASVATDASLSNTFTVTLGGNRTLANPTNLVSGGVYTWIVAQDGTGSRTLAYGATFTWQGGIVPALSTTASAVDVISAVYDGSKLRASIGKTYQ